MLTLEVLNDLRPLARGAHFFVSAFAGLSAYYLTSRTYSDRPMSRGCFVLFWVALSHFALDVVFGVP